MTACGFGEPFVAKAFKARCDNLRMGTASEEFTKRTCWRIVIDTLEEVVLYIGNVKVLLKLRRDSVTLICVDNMHILFKRVVRIGPSYPQRNHAIFMIHFCLLMVVTQVAAPPRR